MANLGSDGVSTVYVHIGTMKTGTTYLQSRFKQHRVELEADGFRYPRHQMHAVRDLFGRRGTLGHRDVRGAWAGLVGELSAPGARVGIVSMEYLSRAEPDRIAEAVDQLRPAEVEIIVTARDVVRVAAAQWQETIQNRAVWTWDAYAASITADPPDEAEPGAKFWRQHDVARIVDGWADVVGMSHLHLVTVPPSGAPPDELWDRFCQVVGIDAARYRPGPEALRSNLGIDPASAELLRRINVRIDRDIGHATYLRHVKQLLGKRVLVQPDRDRKPTMTAEQHEWATAYSRRLVERLRANGIDVVGDLEDLVPAPSTRAAGVSPEPVSDAAVAEAATEVIAALLQRLDEFEPRNDQQDVINTDDTEARPGPANRRRRRRRQLGGATDVDLA